MFKAGHKFEGPDGQGYTLAIDVKPGDVPLAVEVIPYGGAPKPVTGERMPNWMAAQIGTLKSKS